MGAYSGFMNTETMDGRWEELISIGRLMWERSLIAGTDGNLSLRIGPDRILATATGVPKGRMKADDLVVIDASGRRISGDRDASSEIRVHLAAYAVRPDISAVVHAHPPAALAMSLAGIEMEPPFIPESVLSLGPVARAEYRTPGSMELAGVLEENLRCHDAIMMERHGALTLGRSLEEAYNRMESLEHTAKTIWMARALGPVEPLPAPELHRLEDLARKAAPEHPRQRDPVCRRGLQDTGPEEISSLVRDVLARVRERS